MRCCSIDVTSSGELVERKMPHKKVKEEGPHMICGVSMPTLLWMSAEKRVTDKCTDTVICLILNGVRDSTSVRWVFVKITVNIFPREKELYASFLDMRIAIAMSVESFRS